MGIFACGLLIACYGIALLHRGVFVYQNYYRAEMYSPALIVTGALFIVLALIPDSLVDGLVRRGRR
jgi:hypothetical protein